jgi:hypothetical protein
MWEEGASDLLAWFNYGIDCQPQDGETAGGPRHGLGKLLGDELSHHHA